MSLQQFIDQTNQIVKELNEHQDWHPVSIVYDERNWDFKLFYYIEDDNLITK